jgi:AcrR family transcriptional regulator
MADVKRRYDASKRQEHSARTRRLMLDAARDLLLEQGYAATTLAQVAERAGVAAPTVYKAFGNKPGLIKAVFDYSIAGDDDPTPIIRRERAEKIRREPDPVQKLTLYADGLAGTLERAGRLHLVVRSAAGSEPDIAPVWEQIQQERLVGMTHLARILADGGHLAPGVTADEARDVLWVHTSPELYELFVLQREWSMQRYRDWLVRTLAATLLP